MMFKRISSFIFIIALLTFFSMSYNIVDPGGTVEQQSEITSTVINDDVQYTFLSTDVVQVKEKIQLAGIGIPTIAFATIQNDTVVEEVLPIDIVKDTFTTLAGLAATILLLTSLAKKWLKSNDDVTIILSGIISFIITALGWYFKLGIFDGLEWYYIFIYGFSAGVVANGFSTWGYVSMILQFFKLKVPKKKTPG